MERPPAVPACPLLKWVGIGAGMAYALFLFHMPVMRGMAGVLRMLRASSFILGNRLVCFPGYRLFRLSACGGLPGGEEAEKGAGNPE